MSAPIASLLTTRERRSIARATRAGARAQHHGFGLLLVTLIPPLAVRRCPRGAPATYLLDGSVDIDPTL